jgi:hypothetical protein
VAILAPILIVLNIAKPAKETSVFAGIMGKWRNDRFFTAVYAGKGSPLPWVRLFMGAIWTIEL